MSGFELINNSTNTILTKSTDYSKIHLKFLDPKSLYTVLTIL